MGRESSGGAERLSLFSEQVGRWALFTSVVLLAVAAGGLVIGNEVVIGLPLGFGIVGLIVVLVTLLTTRKTRRILAGMVAGDHFVHWTYESALWQQHLDAERKRGRNHLLWGLAIGLCIGAVAAALVVGAALAFEEGPLSDLLPGLYFLSIPVAICVLVGVALQVVEVLRRRHLRRAGGRIDIGPQGVYSSGEFWPSGRGNPRFLSLTHERGPPPSLRFSFRVHQPKGGSYIKEVWVPIPPGKELESEDVIERVRATW
jgi:hypothetical protein